LPNIVSLSFSLFLKNYQNVQNIFTQKFADFEIVDSDTQVKILKISFFFVTEMFDK